VAGNSQPIGEFQIEDPTYLTFNLRFLFTPTESITGLVAGLLLPRNNVLSACNYLDRINEPNRADLLEKFISDLQTISMQYPWYFQTITGVQKLTQMHLEDAMSVHGGDDSALEIDCLYRKATYDRAYRRNMLPDNLRQFNCQIYVTEFRKFHTFTTASPNNSNQSPLAQVFDGLQDISNLAPTVNSLLSSRNIGSIINNGSILADQLSELSGLQAAAAKIISLDNFISVLTYNLDRCTFNLDDLSPFLTELSAAKSDDPIKQKFKIVALKFSENNNYPISKMVLLDQINRCQYPNGTYVIPTPGVGNVVAKGQIGNNVESIVEAIFPSTDMADNISSYEVIKENELTQDNIYDQQGNVIQNALNTFNQYASTLEQRFQQLGINSVAQAVGNLQNGINDGFSNVILNNIFDINPSLENQVVDISNIDLVGKPENFQSQSNIDLKGTVEPENIAKITLTETDDNFQDSAINLKSNVENFKVQKISLTGQEEDFKVTDIKLTAQALQEKLKIQNIYANYQKNSPGN
jgi:hypothetical protein